MTATTRIKGVALTLKFGTTDYKADVTACTLTNEEAESDVVTFEDAAGEGQRQFYLNITAIQSTDTASFWRYVWENAGTTVAFVYAPHGNETASAAQPHFTGNVKVGPRPTIGGEAGAGNTFTFETQWEVEGVPTMVTTGA